MLLIKPYTRLNPTLNVIYCYPVWWEHTCLMLSLKVKVKTSMIAGRVNIFIYFINETTVHFLQWNKVFISLLLHSGIPM